MVVFTNVCYFKQTQLNKCNILLQVTIGKCLLGGIARENRYTNKINHNNVQIATMPNIVVQHTKVIQKYNSTMCATTVDTTTWTKACVATISNPIVLPSKNETATTKASNVTFCHIFFARGIHMYKLYLIAEKVNPQEFIVCSQYSPHMFIIQGMNSLYLITFHT